MRIQSPDVTIENPAGSTRPGKAKDGSTWSTTMQAHYGYVRGSVSAIAGYTSNYDEGWKVGPMTPMTLRQFKD